ncbi:MAG: helix-turn-helix transcriptional regulator [Halobacteriales archaeon]
MRVPAALCLALLVVHLVAGGAVAADPGTTMRVAVQADGDARWTVTARFDVAGANETRGFDRLAEAFRAGESDALSVVPFRRAARAAERATGRNMAIENVSRSAGRGDGTGRLVLSFTWTAFAQVDGNRLAVGDAFRSPSGTWLPGLTEDQTFVMTFPESYAIISVSRPAENGSLRIRGPASFSPGRPSAVLVPRRTDRSGVTTETPTPPPSGGISPALGIGALVVVAGVLALLVGRRRYGGGEGPTEEPPAPPGDGDTGAETEPPEEAEPTPDPEATTGEAEMLLSDEERVLRLLEEHDGRMKQADIVDETGWSNAKVSQLLSEMNERGEVEKLRLGRENLISLPGEAPDE